MSSHLELGRRCLDRDESDERCIKHGKKLEAARQYLIDRGIVAFVVGSKFKYKTGPGVLDAYEECERLSRHTDIASDPLGALA